jgi:hypothetical protein
MDIGQRKPLQDRGVRRIQTELNAKHHFTKTNCPWSNGTIESACKQVIRAFRAVLRAEDVRRRVARSGQSSIERPEQFSIDEADQEDAHASLHWT